MKKTGKILCLILTFFVCAFFSACKINYNKLKLSFCSNSGEAIDSVRLLIDPNNQAEEMKTIAVKFDGIKENQIGDIIISANPTGLASISNQNIEDGKCFFDITAIEQGAGRITVQHLGSGKNASINLVVDKKSTTATKRLNEFVIAIPAQAEEYNLNVDQLVSQDGTDKVGFQLAENYNLPDGVTPITTDFGTTTVLTGFNLTPSIRHNTTTTLYPVLFMEGYDDVDNYASQAIKIIFVRALSKETFILDTDNAHKTDGVLNLNQPFHLMAKDTDQATGENYQYNNINFDLKYKNSQDQIVSFTKIDGQPNTTGLEYLQKYYDVSWQVPSQFSNLLEVFLNETANTMQVVIEAKDYASETARVKIRLVPKMKGNLQTVEKTVLIKCDVKPTEYEISVQGKIQQNNGAKNEYNIDLYDYYRTTDSVYGANFTFKPLVEYSYADLKDIRLKVSPAVLDTSINTIAFEDGESSTAAGSIASNRYLLQFHIGGKPVKFKYDAKSGLAISVETIKYTPDLTRVQIKYIENAENDNVEQLSCIVENWYSGNYAYLTNIGLTSAKLLFNRKDGVQSLDVFAGVLTKYENTNHVETIDDTKSVSQVYLNRTEPKSNSFSAFYITNIKGDRNKEISKVSFDIKVIGGGLNPIKLQQNTLTETGTEPSTEIVYNYETTAGNPGNAVIFVVDQDTDIGNYQIIITYADDIIFSFNCLVYEELKDDQIETSVANNLNLINNKFDTDGNRPYAEYDVDYIVKADRANTIEVSVMLPEQFTSDSIVGYTFELTLISKDGQAINSVNMLDFANIVVVNNKAVLTFVKGSVYNNEIAYIKLSMKVKKQVFTNILTKDGIEESGEKTISFFVFEQISKEEISLNKTLFKGYWGSLLGAYSKEEGNDLSKVDLKVSLTDQALWNYVQPQAQIIKDYKIGYGLILVDSDAVFDESKTYFYADGRFVEAENLNEAFFEQNKDKIYVEQTDSQKYKVVWYTKDSDSLITTAQDQTGIYLTFNGISGQAEYDIYAMVKQFNLPEIVLKCHIEISEPIITDRVTIVSPTKQISGSESKRVISLKAGESYEMQVEYYSNKFESLPSYQREITNPGFVMLVVDKSGNIHNSVVSVVGNSLQVKENFTLTSQLRVLVFAKDALKDKLQDVSGYNNPSAFLMDDHSTAYAEIDLVVSNGSRQNPYPVFNEEDFWAINKDNLSKTKYYQLMNNIYLKQFNTIDNFTGGILTYSNNTYFTIFGLTLDNSKANLFTNFAGIMQNVNFDVKYNYIYNADRNNPIGFKPNSANLGVFSNLTDAARLTNVTVNATGTNLMLLYTETALPKVDQTITYVNFGGLVGLNQGIIEYTDKTLVGATVNINLQANYVYFGGLVGLNQGTIKTNFIEDSTSTGQNIEFGSFLASQGNVSYATMAVSGFEYGAVGGVVGANSGILNTVYADGSIVSLNNKKANSIGGIIGKNIYQTVEVSVEYNGGITSFKFVNDAGETTYPVLSNLKSSVQIIGGQNIGGITGVDENGIYSNCKYQVLANSVYGLDGTNNVGGIIGFSTNSMLEYCSVFSYRWDYSKLTSISSTENSKADIVAESEVGGFVGFAISNITELAAGGTNTMVAIKNSSVNAYISATKQTGAKINMFVGKNGQTPANETTLSGVLDSYYVGKIDCAEVSASQNIDFVEVAAAVNFVYAFTDTQQKYLPETGTDFNITRSAETGEITKIESTRAGWQTNVNLNGGNSYLVLNNKPIFEVAPTSIGLTFKGTACSNYGIMENGRYVTDDNIGPSIHLQLTDYNLDPNSRDYTELYQQQLNKNTYLLTDIYQISAEPKTLLSEVRLRVSSSNAAIVMIDSGKLVVRASGAATINFVSVLNNQVSASVLVYVTEPVGENLYLNLSNNGQSKSIQAKITHNNDKLETISLTKGEAVLLTYQALQTADLSVNGNTKTVNLTTYPQTWLKVGVTAFNKDSDGNLTQNNSIDFANYLEISGTKNADNFIRISYDTPFSIKATQKIDDVVFKFTVTPYVSLGAHIKENLKTFVFNVETTAGITDLSLGCENVILYPNDTTTISAYLETDKPIVFNKDAMKLIESIKLNDAIITATSTGDFGTVSKYISVIELGELNSKLNLQVIKFSLTIPEDIKEKLINNVTNTMFVNFKAGEGFGNGAKDSLQLSLLKQRIDELIVRNYIYSRNQDGSFDYTTYIQNNTLRPVSEGLITIDLAPINGNCDYFEISDITGTEEILFVQTEGIHGKRILGNVQPSADGKGIRLKPIAGSNTIYVATMIDSKYTNRNHTVKVNAYAANTIVKSSTIDIDVKMLPEASIYLVTNGQIERNTTTQQYVAQKTNVRVKVETRNCDETEPVVEAKIVNNPADTSGTTVEITNFGNGIYSVDLGKNAGKYLKIDATARLTLNNGNVEETTTSQSYQIVNYVINNVSVTHSTTNQIDGKKITKIYGNLGQTVPVEFYLNSADLNFEDNTSIIKYDRTTYADSEDGTPQKAIHNLINEINGTNALNYLTFDLSRQTEDADKFKIKETTASGEENRIIKRSVYLTKNGSETEIAYLSLSEQTIDGVKNYFINVYQNTAAKIDVVLNLNLGLENNSFYIVKDAEEGNNSSVVKNLKCIYQLDFIEESSFLEPLAVRSADDFINMSSTGDYILAQDITLEDYSPIDVNLNTFDGNGHTITIKSFALFSDSEIQAGLFKQIYENMVVMNLNVNYSLGREDTGYYYDLCNNSASVEYTTASFGGVTAVNNGIISNCKVGGTVMISASGVEQTVTNDAINFNIGGLVYQNTSTGRITNSQSSLIMVAKANIAGVVVENDGKIASTYFDANNSKGKIYAYNSNVTVPYSIQVAGFVLKNNSQSEISMCYVESGTHLKNGQTIGNISAKDYSSGFVFTNSGSIYDCYADIKLIGESSHNHITGFVYENSGNVKNCYSYINEGRKTNLISMFALENTSGIQDCYEIKQDVLGYKNNVQGLTTISVLSRTNKANYPTFMFGDNISSVWCKTQSGLPKLTATQEKVEFNGNALVGDDVNKEYPNFYHGLKDLQLIVTEVKNELGVVVSKEYKYKTLANNFGDKQNPILIYSLATWDYYLGQTDVANSYYENTKYYYRLINDIDFATVYNNPSTSTVTFNGNLQGNNMDILNFKIYSSQNLSSIGLFAEIVSLDNGSIESTIRNLDLAPISITASRTMAVGTLVGVADNYNLYNIDVEGANQTVVGGNAVGGVVGLLRGKFDVDGISANIGAYASRSQTDNAYRIFSSTYVANNFNSSNLSSVYYAGGAIGIADSFNGVSQTVNPSNENILQVIRHVSITGAPILFGDTVGGAVGLLGKNVKLSYANINITGGKLSGYQYSAGVVGENRGVIQNVNASVLGNDLFKNSTYVSAGLVGFNLNGLIDNANVYAEISKINQSIVAGVVGRNLLGYVKNISFDGLLSGYYGAAIIGADYGITTYMNKSVAGGGGAISISQQNLESLTASIYTGTTNFDNLQIGKTCLDNIIVNINNYYVYEEAGEAVELKTKKVLGLVVGLTDKQNVYNFKYGYNEKTNMFVVNGGLNIDAVGYIKKTTANSSVQTEFTIGFINIIKNFALPKEFGEKNAILYVVGAKVSSFDFWLTQYGFSNECFAFAAEYTELVGYKMNGSNPTTEKEIFYVAKYQGELSRMSKNDKYNVLSVSGNKLTIEEKDIKELLVDADSESEFIYQPTVSSSFILEISAKSKDNG